jgi:hypothetical protein
MRAATQPAVQYEPHPDAGTDGNERERVYVPPVTVRLLCQGRSIHIVLDHQRVAERGSQVTQQIRVLPALQSTGEEQRVLALVVDPWTAQHGLYDVADLELERCAQPFGQPDELGHSPPAALRPRVDRVPNPDGTREVADCTADVLPADVKGQHVTSLRPHLVEDRVGAGATGSDSGRPDHPGPLEVRERQRDCRLGEPAQPG